MWQVWRPSVRSCAVRLRRTRTARRVGETEGLRRWKPSGCRFDSRMRQPSAMAGLRQIRTSVRQQPAQRNTSLEKHPMLAHSAGEEGVSHRLTANRKPSKPRRGDTFRASQCCVGPAGLLICIRLSTGASRPRQLLYRPFGPRRELGGRTSGAWSGDRAQRR